MLRFPLLALTVLVSSLCIISIFVHGLKVELIAMPEKIYTAYRIVIDLVFKWLFEFWLPFKFPTWLKDAISFWIFCSATLYRYYKWIGQQEWIDDRENLKELNIFILLGPITFLACVGVFNEKGNEHSLFYVSHLLILAIYGVITALFFWWNHALIVSLNT